MDDMEVKLLESSHLPKWHSTHSMLSCWTPRTADSELTYYHLVDYRPMMLIPKAVYAWGSDDVEQDDQTVIAPRQVLTAR